MIVMGHAGQRHIRECTGSPDLLGTRPQAFTLAAINLAGAFREGDAVATHKLAVNQDYYMRNCCNNGSLTISKPGPNPAEQCPRRTEGRWLNLVSRLGRIGLEVYR
jgi:hypothetical protein